MKFLRVIIAFLIVISSGRTVPAQQVKVLVLDALNGRPQANVKINYFCVGTPGNFESPIASITDNEGFATISIACNGRASMSIDVFPSDKKEQCGDDVAFSFGNPLRWNPPITLNNVLSEGFVSKPDSAGNSWCPTKISRKIKAVPGLIAVFVKKPTWYQSHVAG